MPASAEYVITGIRYHCRYACMIWCCDEWHAAVTSFDPLDICLLHNGGHCGSFPMPDALAWPLSLRTPKLSLGDPRSSSACRMLTVEWSGTLSMSRCTVHVILDTGGRTARNDKDDSPDMTHRSQLSEASVTVSAMPLAAIIKDKRSAEVLGNALLAHSEYSKDIVHYAFVELLVRDISPGQHRVKDNRTRFLNHCSLFVCFGDSQ